MERDREMEFASVRRRVELSGPDPSWPTAYAGERAAIAEVLGTLARGIEHIGSTSIPGIRAKPILDVMVGVGSFNQFEDCRSRLEAMGYVYDPLAMQDDPDRRVFRRGPADQMLPRTHHLHMTRFGGWYWRRILAFRDHLRRNPRVATDYERLKIDLAERFREDGRRYTAGKGAFVREIQAIALKESV